MSVLLAKPWNDKVDPTGWWMSEKLDGVRAIWRPDRMTGDSHGQFLSRNMKLFYAPQWFKDIMPDVALDGELFVGRKKFDQTVSIVRAHDDRGWDKVCFRVFDIYPDDREASDAPPYFELRQARLRRLVRKVNAPKVIRIVPHVQCEGVAHLTQFADEIEAKGGEGVMLRQARSLYEKKRSGTLLKVKRFFDCEAQVFAHVDGKGKHKGRMGALKCVLLDKDGLHTRVKFEVGTGFTDAEREDPPSVGATITVRYQELTKDGVPRFPVYVTERDYE